LAGQTGNSCGKYEALLPSGVLAQLVALSNFFEWVVREGGAPRNPVTPVMSRYLERNRDFWDERRRNPNRRRLKDAEVNLLVTSTPPHISIAVTMMAAGFLRIHEAMKLSVAPQFLDLDERLITIPADANYGGKRQGVNHKVWLNDALLAIVRRYLIWREHHVARDDDGNPRTDKLCLTRLGNAWSPNGFQGNFKNALHKECIRLGIMTGRETQSRERVNPHAFRAWACTWAALRGADSTQVRYLKGDRQPGAIDMYVDMDRGLADLYKRFGPILEVGP
jgi:integrase